MSIRYHPTSMSEFFHMLPHAHNDRLAPNYYRNDEFYNNAIANLAIVPVYLILALSLVIFIIYAMKLLYRVTDPAELCSCRRVKIAFRMGLAMFILILMLLLIEIVLQLKGIGAHNRHYLPWLAYDAREYREQFDNLYTPCLFSMALPVPTRNVVTVEEKPIIYRKEFAQFATETQKILKDIKSPYQAPRTIQTPFMQDYLKYIWKRFAFYIMLWMIGVVLVLCRPDRYWVVCVIGLVWVCVAAYYIMADIIMLSDICQDPELFVRDLTNRKDLEQAVTKAIRMNCEQYKYLNERNKPRLTDVYTKWEIVFEHIVNRIKDYHNADDEVYSKDPQYKYADSVHDYLKDCRSHHHDLILLDPEEFSPCDKAPTHYEDVPRDSLMSLCVGDSLLKWLILQLLIILAIAGILIAFLTIHITEPKFIYSSRRVILNGRKLIYCVYKQVTGDYRNYKEEPPKEIECQETQTEVKPKRSKSSSPLSTKCKKSTEKIKCVKTPPKRSKSIDKRDSIPDCIRASATTPPLQDKKEEKRKRHRPRSKRKEETPPETVEEPEIQEKEKTIKAECWSPKVKEKEKKHHHHHHKHRSRSKSKVKEVTIEQMSQHTPSASQQEEEPKKHKKRHEKKKKEEKVKKERKMFVVEIDRNMKMLVPLRHTGFCESSPSTSHGDGFQGSP